MIDYLDKIRNLEQKERYEKEDLLNPEFELFHDENTHIYYAPHNEYVNTDAQVMMIGITPGWTQTEIAYHTAKKLIDAGVTKEIIFKKCKYAARFAGSMRGNLVKMLDELELNQYMDLESSMDLFAEECQLLHTTSLIRYPVFIKGKNYSGTNPTILKSKVLSDYVFRYFVPELQKIKKKCLIIPLGRAVEDVLEQLVKDKIVLEEQCLFGFPHPSGLNAHRISQFEENRDKLKLKMRLHMENNK